MSVGDVAMRLSRSCSSVYQRANILGLSEVMCPHETARIKSRIRTWHARGWSDSEIAAKVGRDRRSVGEMRVRLGLEANGNNERRRRKVSERTKQQCEKAGVANLAEVRSESFKGVARRLGWPDHLSLRAVQILETLYQLGPMTRRQLAPAVGMRWRGSRKTFGNNRVPGGSYLAELQRAGLVIRLEKAITHPGKGNHEDLYMVALEVEPCQKARRQYQSQRSSDQSINTVARSPCKENCEPQSSMASTKRTSRKSSKSK